MLKAHDVVIDVSSLHSSQRRVGRLDCRTLFFARGFAKMGFCGLDCLVAVLPSTRISSLRHLDQKLKAQQLKAQLGNTNLSLITLDKNNSIVICLEGWQ